MKVSVGRVDRKQISDLISVTQGIKLSPEDRSKWDQCLFMTTSLWTGFVDDEFVCAWGLIPPTLLSDQAYLWLYTTDAVKEHEFLFVRHSQRAVEEMLEDYPTITGLTKADNTSAIRWLRWLGATFKEGDNGMVPFVIRKKH